MRYKPGFGNGVVSGAVGGLCCALPRLSCARRAGPTATLFILVLVASILAGCIPAVSEQNHLSGTAAGSQMPTEPDLQSVIAAKKQSPGGSSAALAAQRHAEEEAATRYLIAGTKARLAGRLDEAVRLFELGLAAQPQNLALIEAKAATRKQKEVLRFSAGAKRAKNSGNTELAQTLYRKAELLDRGNAKALASLREIEEEKERRGETLAIEAFESRAAMELNFRNAKLKDALLAIASPHDLNVVFDSSVENIQVSVSAKQLTFYQAFQLLLQSGDCFYKALSPNSVLIAKNEKKEKYADLYFKTFYLQTIKAVKMAEILASSVSLKMVIPNAELNTVQIRASREILKIAERVIAAHDRARAEIALDIEVLEVNRSTAAGLGIDYGSQIALQAPETSLQTVLHAPSEVLAGAAVTLPASTLSYLKNSGDAKTLSRPRVRTVDGEPAVIHVGDKVPLRSASITAPPAPGSIAGWAGQSQTSYEYRDVGVKAEVLPRYGADGSISVDLKLEVSSLGQNLGSAAEPAYSMSTRNVNTKVNLREGEAAILGGFIQEAGRHALNQVPGAANLGIVGRLFAVDDDTATKTDILMTVVAHLVRQRGTPPPAEREFYGGSGDDFTTENPNDYLKRSPSSEAPIRFRVSPNGAQQTAYEEPAASSAGGSEPEFRPAVPPASVKRPQLTFGAEAYSAGQGARVVVEIRGLNLNSATPFTTSVLFNPANLSLEEAQDVQTGAQLKPAETPSGIFKLTVTPPKGKAEGLIARLTFQGREKGLSYLLLNNPEAVLDKHGNAIGMELGSSKAEVR